MRGYTSEKGDTENSMAAQDILIAEAQEKIIPDPQLQTKLGKVKRVRQGKDECLVYTIDRFIE